VEPLIDIVGHFGTTFSYATVASNVARALREKGLLGDVSNLDVGWHPSHDDLRGRGRQQGSHVAVFAGPFHYMEAFAEQYSRERSAIFMSPNTDRLADEHTETCAKFGLAMTPSSWCSSVVRRSLGLLDTQVATLPIGVSEVYAREREGRRMRLLEHAAERPGCHVVHFSSDQSWPGRKGTEELLSAWEILQQNGCMRSRARLTVHLPSALMAEATYRCRDLQIDKSVSLVTTGEHGSPDADLLALLDDADLVVAPSRCEGFGMMYLAALVAGVPLVCTYATGQTDFLSASNGWLGVPTATVDELWGEDGMAPVVEPRVLAATLSAAMETGARVRMVRSALADPLPPEWGTWPAAVGRWVERLTEWAVETSA
jgi:glycosyltransferase involved in cell wall biosynthesis